MEPTRELIDDIFRSKVLAARAMSPEDKLVAGERLFRRSCQIMTDGIRDEFPNADENRIREILDERLALARDSSSILNLDLRRSPPQRDISRRLSANPS